MLRSALILSAGLLAALGFACVAVVPPPPPPPAPAVVPSAAAAASLVGSPKTSAVCTRTGPTTTLNASLIKTPYHPELLRPPTPISGALPGSAAQDLQQAYTVAPDFFQQKLCGLQGIYIDQTPCSGSADGQNCSWGFRDPSSGNEYVGLSASLWADSSPPKFTDYETNQLGYLLQLLGGVQGGIPPFEIPPFFDSQFDSQPGGDPANTPTMTVLATLAHEIGHIRWFEINVTTPGGPYDFGNLNPCKNDNKSFWAASWAYGNNINLLEAPRWRNFADIANTIYLDHVASSPSIRQFLNIQPAGYSALAQSLIRLHSKFQPWPSLLGSLTPDEDFVETYVLGVLTYNGAVPDSQHRPYLSSLRLNVSRQASHPDLVNELFHGNGRFELARKISCIMNLNPPTSPQL